MHSHAAAEEQSHEQPPATQMPEQVKEKDYAPHKEGEIKAATHSSAAEDVSIATPDESAHEQVRELVDEHPEAPLKDLGWNMNTRETHEQPTLIKGMDNDELFMLIRRYNYQVFHVRTIPEPPAGALGTFISHGRLGGVADTEADMYVSDEEEFSPDKLRAYVERLYMTVLIGLASAAKHTARLRSWHERRRTAYFCATYFTAWLLNMVVPLILATVLILIFSPVARRKMFPPAPLALVSASHGGLKTPKAGLLGSKDSMTGAPEARKGEAVEQEAANFVSGVAAVAVGSAAGKGGPVPETTSADGDDMDEGVPDPMQAAAGARKANAVATGGPKVDEHDKTKAPVQNAMWKNLKPLMHALGAASDTWEMFGNALSPVPPFNPLLPRLKLAAPLAPLLLVSLLTPPAYVWRGLTFALGAAFFSDPLMQRGLRKLNRRFPNWPTYLDLRLSLLKGVPTNAQLSVTLLRLAEAKKAPLPPPPTATEPPQDEPVTDLGSDTELDASDEEVRAHVEGKVQTDDTTKEETLGEGEGKPSKPQRASKLLKFVKGTTKGTVSSALGVDRAKAAAGSEPSKRRVGVVDPKDHERDGPSFFLCRHHGKKGHAILSNAATTPCLSFAKGSKEDSKGADPAFSIMIEDICELKKLGGLGWKSKLVVGWALGSEIADGIEIVDKKGETHRLTAISRRDELFNRLIAVGGKYWEAM